MRRIQLLLAVFICLSGTATAQTGKLGGNVTIKTLGVAGPVVGSQDTFGSVTLTAAATQRVVITLVSSNPRIATLPAEVIVGPGQTVQPFVVKTGPVAAPTTLTLTAQAPGSPDAKATLTVIPPSLTILDCEPKSLPGGSQATCKAWMDGVVASGATPQLAISSSNSQVASPTESTVTVPAGSRWVTFQVSMVDLPQSATATIAATYAGVTKTSSLSVTPAAIRGFGCVVTSGSTDNAWGGSECGVTGGDFTSDGYHVNVGFVARLTAPAPAAGYKIPLTVTLAAPPDASGQEPPSSPLGIGIPKTLEVPAGKDRGFFPFHTPPVEFPVVIKVSAKDPITNNALRADLTIHPPHLRGVHIEPPTLNAVPLGGQEAHVRVEFKTVPPSHGIAYDVTYGGTTDIKGPARVRIDPADGSTQGSFKVTISPCAINPPCEVSVSLGGMTGTARVNK